MGTLLYVPIIANFYRRCFTGLLKLMFLCVNSDQFDRFFFNKDVYYCLRKEIWDVFTQKKTTQIIFLFFYKVYIHKRRKAVE